MEGIEEREESMEEGGESNSGMLRVNYDYQSMYDAAKYFLGLCSKLSGQRLTITNIDTFAPEIIEYFETNNLVIAPVNPTRKVRFDPPKQTYFNMKLDRLYSLLEIFMDTKCVFGPNNKIMAITLLQKFSEEIKENVGNKVEFPMLMKRYIENNGHLQLKKKITHKGVSYLGIDLIKDNNDGEQKILFGINHQMNNYDNSNRFLQLNLGKL